MAAGFFITVLLFQIRAAGTIDANNLGAEVKLPTFEARLGIGFNYDLLHDPFDVSFEYPRGYFGFNIPIEKNISIMDYRGKFNESIDSMITANESMFSNLDEFRPTAGARQNPNPTIRVDVPMIGGVASFSSTQNFYINYRNTLGNPNIYMNPSPDSLVKGMSFLLRGTINVPMNVAASWETMTFGYAFEVNRLLKLAVNLHRHVFYIDMRGKINVDLLGRYNVAIDEGDAIDFEAPTINEELDYSLAGNAYGHYEAEVWTPTLAFKAWRFSCISRFGISTKAHGSFFAKYSLPFFIDPVNFKQKYNFEDTDILNDPEVRLGLMSNASDSITYSSRKKSGNGYKESDLEWEMPTGLTLAFDIIPEKIKFSYTKLFGEISMKLDRIAREQRAGDSTITRPLLNDSLVIDYGIKIDHIMVLEMALFHSFLNVGVFSIDFRYADSTNLIGRDFPVEFKLGDAALLPVISLGTALGTKIQLLLELDVLPLPAVKAGVLYYF
jgi:hypothetical protein